LSSPSTRNWERDIETYHPVPQASLRPQRPSAPQHAPHVGVHTHFPALFGPHVPSSVMEPVCHAGGLLVVWANTTAWPESRRPTRLNATRRNTIMNKVL
jgi:hypothetical protein